MKRQRNAERGAGSTQQGDEIGDASSNNDPSPHLPKDGPKDFSLKDGQTFSIKLPGGSNGGRKIRQANDGGGGGGGGGGLFSLPPPPPGRRG